MKQQYVISIEQGLQFVDGINFPIHLYSSFSLGWHQLANNQEEFSKLLEKGLNLSPVHQDLLSQEPKQTEQALKRPLREVVLFSAAV